MTNIPDSFLGRPPRPDLAAHLCSIDDPQERWRNLDSSPAVEIDTLSLTNKGEGLHGPAITNPGNPTMDKLNIYPTTHARLLLHCSPTDNPYFTQQKPKRPLSSWVLFDKDFVRWYSRLVADETTVAQWRDAGIDRFLSLCANLPQPDVDLFKAAICFWFTESNSFIFPLGTMTITLLDLVTLTGLSRCRPPAVARTPFSPNNPSHFDRSYRSIYNTNSQANPAAPVTDKERAYLIHHWLNKFILCLGSSKLVQDTETSSEISARRCVNLAEFVMCHLYKGLYLTVKQIKRPLRRGKLPALAPFG
ncbi:unnamed protein product [Linum trigynum]|uniref:Aminotransferase-like plant mobile domain-containing protein n=1 Tax=Linum trigynum TaxID=586398 RepID=A0AAV2FUV6_9ROSI